MTSESIAGNPHPWRVAFTIALGILLIFIALAAMSVVDGQVLGGLMADLLFVCLVLGFWARRSKSSWTGAGWTWRLLLVAIVMVPVLNILRVAGQTAP